MKKIFMLAVFALGTSSAFALTTIDGSTAATSGNVTNGTCGAISTTETPKINVSKGNKVSYDCTTVAIGVGATSTAGKGRIYTTNSNGGALTETNCTIGSCDQAGAATTAKNQAS